MRFASCLAAVALSAVPASSACASRPAERSVSFVCDGGKSFLVHYLNGRVTVTTEAGRWQLFSRPSSIGAKFASDSATFIHDEDRAALNGLPGGPFRRCREGVARIDRRNGGAPLL